jgi:hypothetical protein
VTKDKYIAGPTSRTRPVEAASAVTSSAVGISVRVHFFITPIRVSSDGQLTIVGTIQATLPCDLETSRCRLIWLGMLALDKTEHKSRSPNRCSSPKWVVQNQRARRAIIGRHRPLLAITAKSASPTMTASKFFNCRDFFRTNC